MKMNNISTISKVYAKALFEADIDDATIKTQLAEILNVIDSSEDLKIVLANSSISSNKKNEILEEIFRDKTDAHLLNLLKLLIEKNRISDLRNIYDAFILLDNKGSNKKNVEIVSSVELSEKTKSRILDKLSQKLKCEVVPQWQIDKSIIAGLVFKYEDYVLDTSVLAKLKQLSKQ